MDVVDGTDPATSSELGLKMVKVTTKVWEAIYHVYSFRNIDFRVLVDGQEPTY